MYSSTKATITDTQIQALVRHAFGSGASAASINAIDSGMMNAAFHLSLSGVSQDASEVLLKVSFPPGADVLTYEHDIMKAEIQFYRHLADEALPIPVPRILFCGFSHRLIVNDYFFMTKLSGTKRF